VGEVRVLHAEDAARLEAGLKSYSPEMCERASVMAPAEVAAYADLARRGVIRFDTVCCPNGRVVTVARTNERGRLALALRACADWKVD